MSGFGTYTPANWQMIPSAQVIKIPHKIFPFTFLTTRMAVIITPIMARRTVIPTSLNAPAPSLSPWNPSNENRDSKVLPPITTFAFWSPINAINRPMPTLTACFSVIGIALKIASRTLKHDKKIKITPSINTAASAICQEYPYWRTTVYAKYAFSPIPGASANG